MNKHQDEQFIFVTPYLNEIKRIQEGTKAIFRAPQNFNRSELLGGEENAPKQKIRDFNDFLIRGDNQATTHTTFTNSTKETVRFLQDNNYHLIIDEALDVLIPFNNLVEKQFRVNNKTLALILHKGIVEVDDYGHVKWTGGDFDIEDRDPHAFAQVQRYAQDGTLLLCNDTLFVWEFPRAVLDAAEDITILTYNFEGSYMSPYLRLHNMDYSKSSVSGTYGEGFDKTSYHIDSEKRSQWKKLITFYDDDKNRIDGSMSVTFYKDHVQGRRNSVEASQIRNAMLRCFRNLKAAPEDVMWTCPKASRNDIAPKGYKHIRELTDDEKKGKSNDERERYIDDHNLRCWVASTAKATNAYSDRHVLAYMMKLSPHPDILNYFSQHGIDFSKRDFALNGLIQWIGRSAIRKGEPITLYLPCPYMRKLLSKWLDGKI